MIAGFDPGETSALAVIDINGDLLFLKTFRGGFKQAVEHLRSTEKPAIVASDKTRQDKVSKLAASFNAKAFFPKKDLTISEKTKLVRGFSIDNDHERDALASAFNAHKNYQRFIRSMKRIERDIFLNVLRGKAANPKDALKQKFAGLEPPSPKQRKSPKNLPATIKNLQTYINQLELRFEAKQIQLEKLKGQIKILNSKKPSKNRPKILSGVAKSERAARLRLEGQLKASHARVLKIEAELQSLKRASRSKPEKVKDIRGRVLDMIADYKRRFK